MFFEHVAFFDLVATKICIHREADYNRMTWCSIGKLLMDKKTGNHQQVSYSNEADIILSGPPAVQGHVTKACINQKRTIASVYPESKDKSLVANKTHPSEQKRLSATGTSHMLFLQAMFCRGH